MTQVQRALSSHKSWIETVISGEMSDAGFEGDSLLPDYGSDAGTPARGATLPGTPRGASPESSYDEQGSLYGGSSFRPSTPAGASSGSFSFRPTTPQSAQSAAARPSPPPMSPPVSRHRSWGRSKSRAERAAIRPAAGMADIAVRRPRPHHYAMAMPSLSAAAAAGAARPRTDDAGGGEPAGGDVAGGEPAGRDRGDEGQDAGPPTLLTRPTHAATDASN